MAYRPDDTDPFYGGERIPSLSWDKLPIGATFTVRINEPAKLLQSAEFGTGALKFWDTERTRPVMCAVLNVTVVLGPHSVDEERSIWAQIPSNLFLALKEAQKQADCKFLPGGTLHLRFVGEQPHKTKGFNAIKQYQARYIPPVQTQGPDPFVNGEAPAQSPRPPVAPPAARPTTPAPKW